MPRQGNPSSASCDLVPTIFDAHLHVIDRGFRSSPTRATCRPRSPSTTIARGSRRSTSPGGAVVSGSFQAFDETYLVDALAAARLDGFVGVAQIPESRIADDEALRRCAAAGVRACRANLHSR